MTTALMEPTPAVDAPASDELLLIDLSSIAHPIWHMSQSDPNPNATSIAIVDRVRSLASSHPHAAICCDSGKSFRAELDPNYKAQRPERDATLYHQIKLAVERLREDGFPIWKARGFEADDVIASATAKALAIDGASVLIASADKDLLQLVTDRVRVLSPKNGNQHDAAAVEAKFCVPPSAIRDYLTLVGDASDNIQGAKGIGPKRAAELLAMFGSLDELYAAIDKGEAKLTPSVAASLAEFRGRYQDVRNLITLRADVEIPFEEIAAERTPVAASTIVEEEMSDAVIEAPAAEPQAAQPAVQPEIVNKPQNGTGQQAMVSSDALAPAPTEFERQLEPRSIGQAFQLAKAMYEARMFNGYGSAQSVLSTVMAGRELGMQAVASLRAFHIIEGKHALAADAMRGLVLRSGAAKYFRVIERTPQRATFETHRHGEPEPVALTYTIEEGYAAFKPDLSEADRKKKWEASAWGKHPADMLAARASSKLARLVYADILFGLYAPEELRD